MFYDLQLAFYKAFPMIIAFADDMSDFKTNLMKILGYIYAIIAIAAVGLAAINIAINGVRYFNMLGDPKSASEAKHNIVNTVIGLACVLGATWAVSKITAILGNGTNFKNPNANFDNW